MNSFPICKHIAKAPLINATIQSFVKELAKAIPVLPSGAILANPQKQNKFELRGYESANWLGYKELSK